MYPTQAHSLNTCAEFVQRSVKIKEHNQGNESLPAVIECSTTRRMELIFINEMASLLAYFAHPHCKGCIYTNLNPQYPWAKTVHFQESCRRAFPEHPFLFLFVWLCLVCRGWKAVKEHVVQRRDRPSTPSERGRGRGSRKQFVIPRHLTFKCPIPFAYSA